MEHYLTSASPQKERGSGGGVVATSPLVQKVPGSSPAGDKMFLPSETKKGKINQIGNEGKKREEREEKTEKMNWNV